MGCWDVFCPICGLSCNQQEYLLDANEVMDQLTNGQRQELTQILSKGSYLSQCTFLTIDDQVFHGCQETACNITFECKNKTFESINDGRQIDYFANVSNRGSDAFGMFIHTSCWKWMKREYKIDLKYSDLPVVTPLKFENEPIVGIDYGPIKKYWSQDFDFIQLIKDKKGWMAANLLRNNPQNHSRVQRIVSQFKIKRDANRKGPVSSATFYPEGSIRIGKNKRFWIKKGSRWVEIPEGLTVLTADVTSTDRKAQKFVNSMPMIGEYGRKPLFVLSVAKSSPKKFTVKILLKQSDKAKLDELLKS
jgi:hypothetical protein